MRLYTEEQVKHIVHLCNVYGVPAERFLPTVTPIEPPSNELIVLKRWGSFEEVSGLEYEESSYVDGFTKGAKWMRDIIFKTK